MNEEVIKFETALLAKNIGFTLQTVGSHVYNYYEDDGRDGYISWGHLHTNSPAKVPQSLLQKYLRDNHDIHINIRRENYFQVSKYEYYHYDISHGELTDVSEQEDLRENIMDDCLQDIVGNYLNDEKYSKLIFERKFAFKTYEEALEDGLIKCLKLIN
jgi:hypothetical protein